MGRQKILFLLCLLFCSFLSFSQFKNEGELKKQATQYFEDEDYANGFKLYSQLVANYPKDPSHNYRLGVCMLFSDPNKKKCMPYLKLAIDHIKDSEKEAYFYLGKAYHLNFQFDEAIKYYNLYKLSGASSSMQKKLLVDHEIQCCKNGKRLLANLRELVILDKKELSLTDYFRSYDLKDIGGKLLVKPADFTSIADKKKKDKSIIYLPANKELVYYASYGEKGDNKDIYIVRRMPDGNWSKPETLGEPINTIYDEDFPFLHPNGKILYFASKGHNSMGGYDIFKSEFDDAGNVWKEPVNLDFPINSPDDDVLFITDSLEKIAFLASTRQSPLGRIDVYKILTERRPAEYAFIKGTVVKKNENQSVQSKINVKNIDNGEDAGTFLADENGEYAIKIPNGGKYIFTVETPGYPTQSEGVTLPTAYDYKPYRQTIEYNDQKLQITNFFETNDNDENNYAQYLKLIEEKTKMNVNAGDFDINPNNPLTTNSTTNPKNNTANTEVKNTETVTTTTSNPTNTNSTKTNLNNKELVKMANDDAKELQQNADSLKKDAAVAFSAANSKQDQANEKKQEAQDLQNKANTETNSVQKQELTAQAEKAKEEADLYVNQANTANNIAKQMEVDATNKQKEADLNAQYAKALEEAEKTKNNKQAIAKLEELQKQLEEATKQKSQTSNLVESIKADAQNKEQELQSAETKQKKLDAIITELNKQYADLDKQEKETNDKDLLENIKTQKEEITSDLNEKQKESLTNQTKIVVLKEEADALKSQAEYASNILSGTAATNTVSTANNEIKNTTNENPPQTTGFEIESKKYTDELEALSNSDTNLDNNKKKSEILNQYTAATDKELKDKKEEIKKAKTQNEKTALTKEIKQLSDKKTQLEKETKIVNAQIKEQEKQVSVVATNNNPDTTNNTVTSNTTTAVEVNNNPTNTTNPIVTNTTNEDPKLKSLNELLNEALGGYTEEKKVFGEITYSDQKALQLKKQADEKFTGLQQNNTRLEQQLEELKAQLSDNSGNEQKIQEKTKQADDLTAQALQIRKEAKTMTGSDKQSALNKILALEKEASALKYQIAKDQYQMDDNIFESNKAAITKIEQQNKKQSPEIQQAKNLTLQSEKIKLDAAKLREEAEKEPSQEARTGALSNADQKEKEALAKQEEALALLKKANPNANTKQNDAAIEKQIAEIKNQLDKEKQTDNSALKLLTDANKAEYTASLNEYSTEEKKSGANYDAQELKAKAENSDKDAALDLAKILTTKDELQKRDLYLSANSKLEEAITQIRKAKQALSAESAVATDTVTPVNTNTVEPISTETTTAATNTVTTDVVESNTTTPVNTNTVEPVNTNTVTSVNTNALTETQVTQIKNTTEYQKVTSLKNSVNKYNDAANNDVEKAQEENIKAAQLTQEASTMPDGPDKQKKEQEAQLAKQKSDSLQEMSSNTRAYANSKKQELDDYTQALDKTTIDNIEAVSFQPTTETPSKQNEDYSSDFNKKTIQLDEQLVNLRDKSSNPDNLNQQNELLTTYINAIESEVSKKKKQQTSTGNQEEKNKIAQEIKTLQLQKIKLNNERSTNENNIKLAGGTNTVTNNQPRNNQPTNNSNTPATSTEKYLNEVGFEVKKDNAYSASNPIPVDEKLPDGLFFRVQIGAFKNQISADRFSGLAPIGAENTPSGLVRYQVGMFNKYQTANAVKNDLRKLKYNDAFVVAYRDGKRISLAEALDTLRKTGEDVTPNANSTAGISTNSNIPINPEATALTTAPVKTSGELNTMNGVFYTIQIGVYGNNVSAAGLLNLSPVYKEALPTGYNRYTAGIYNNFDKVKTDRARVNSLGINDAFVSGYLNGQRVTVNEPLDKLSGNAQFLPERPIIFPTGNQNQATNNTNTITTNVKPFTNGVTQGPAPTALNGVKTTDAGITFKVQIGAYRNQVPAAIANNWLKIKAWPIKYAQVNDLYLYTAGSFVESRFAKALKAEIISLGITDAFVTVFKDGKKLYGAEAAQYLNR